MARVFVLARYRGVARRLLIAYKERGRRDLAASLGRAMAEALVVLPLRRASVAGVGAGPARSDLPGPALGGAGPCFDPRLAAPAGPGFPDSRLGGSGPASPSFPDPALVGLSSSPGRRPKGPPVTAANGSRFAREAGTASAARAICLVPAPSRRSASRVRGGPHVERLADAAASVLAGWGFEVAVAPALELAGGARDAVGLDRAERVANLAGRLRFREAGRPPPGFPVVVLDDVITTGATAAACVRALEGEGIEVAAVLTLLAAG
nr:ComF family protein [Amycolatopsis camponoti]